MSKNISIQEGNTARTVTASKIKVNLVGGGTALFIPEDEAEEAKAAAVAEAVNDLYAELLTTKWGNNPILGTWVLNNEITSYLQRGMTIYFTSAGNNYQHIERYTGDIMLYDSTRVYTDSWVAEYYKTITITGGLDAENPVLLAWLQENGVKQ